MSAPMFNSPSSRFETHTQRHCDPCGYPHRNLSGQKSDSYGGFFIFLLFISLSYRRYRHEIVETIKVFILAVPDYNYIYHSGNRTLRLCYIKCVSEVGFADKREVSS